MSMSSFVCKCERWNVWRDGTVLRALNVLAEDLSSIPSNRIMALAPFPEGLVSSACLQQHCVHMCRKLYFGATSVGVQPRWIHMFRVGAWGLEMLGRIVRDSKEIQRHGRVPGGQPSEYKVHPCLFFTRLWLMCFTPKGKQEDNRLH